MLIKSGATQLEHVIALGMPYKLVHLEDIESLVGGSHGHVPYRVP
jgi:hypothetical protein